MKYLKTYEELTVTNMKDKIEDWMKQHGLIELDLTGMDTFKTYPPEKIFQMIKLDDSYIYFENIDRPGDLMKAVWKELENNRLLINSISKF